MRRGENNLHTSLSLRERGGGGGVGGSGGCRVASKRDEGAKEGDGEKLKARQGHVRKGVRMS